MRFHHAVLGKLLSWEMHVSDCGVGGSTLVNSNFVSGIGSDTRKISGHLSLLFTQVDSSGLRYIHEYYIAESHDAEEC